LAVIQQLRPTPSDEDRRHAILAPFIHPVEVDALLHQQPIRLVDQRPPAEVFAEAQNRVAQLPPYVAEAPAPLPADLGAAAQGIESRPVFQREYAAKARVSFGVVPLRSLITPQAVADLDYVDDLLYEVPHADDADANFHFSFPAGSVPEPAVIGNTVMFTTFAPNLAVVPVPSYRTDADGFEIVVKVQPRPNYLYVATLRNTANRLLVANGVHHVLALLKAGRTHAPALICDAGGIEEIGLPPTTLLSQVGAPRPPLVADFLEPVAIPVLRRRTAIAWRIAVQSDQLSFPVDRLTPEAARRNDLGQGSLSHLPTVPA